MPEALRFEDLQLFEDDQLDQSIEVARAQQEVSLAVDDVLPTLDALVSTLLGWRTIQPGLNPAAARGLRSRAPSHAWLATRAGRLGARVPDRACRRPAGRKPAPALSRAVRLAALVRASSRQCPSAAGCTRAAGPSESLSADSVSKTLLTLDRLRKLLAGDFDSQAPRQDFLLHGAGLDGHAAGHEAGRRAGQAAGAAAQGRRSRPPADMLAEVATAQDAAPRLGVQLGEEVVRLMFDNLAQDQRLLPGFKRQLKAIEPAMLRLAEQDSRFFSDRTHPAREFLDRITQRSLAFTSESDPGWRRFHATVEDSVRWLDQQGGRCRHLRRAAAIICRRSGPATMKACSSAARKARGRCCTPSSATCWRRSWPPSSRSSSKGLDVADFVGDFLRNHGPRWWRKPSSAARTDRTIPMATGPWSTT